METKALEPRPNTNIQTIRNLLERSKTQIAMALPRHITADRLIRVALTSCQKNPQLLQCDQMSLLGAIMQSAQLGLEPDGVTGLAYLVPFWNSKKKVSEVQLIPGYKGLMALARRSGDIGAIVARVVREKDDFKYEFGLQPILKHIPREDEIGEITHVYGIAYFKDGSSPQFEVMTVNEIKKVRERSKAKEWSPWVTDFEEMAKKTVIRRLLKYAPTSIEVQRAIALEEHVDAGIPQDLESILPVEPIVEVKPAVAAGEVKKTEIFGDAQEPA
jgi:recombination protein RecT